MRRTGEEQAISQGDEGATTATSGHLNWQVGAASGRGYCTSQADSASSILVTRSKTEGPGRVGIM